MVIDERKTYRPRQELILREIAGEHLLIPVKGKLADLQRMYVLTPVAAFIWGQLDGQSSLGDIEARIPLAFDVPDSEAHQDCRVFIDQLINAELVEEACA